MGYNDDYYENYFEYDDCIEPVSLVVEGFSEDELTDTLMTAGLIFERTPRYVGNMEKLVFLLGEDSEVYSSAEIQFTEHIQNVYVYPDFYKSMSYGKSMVCRVIAAKIDCIDNEAPMDCIFFEKIIDKAFDGFNVFFFIGSDSVFFGCRIFDRSSNYDCALSHPISSEMMFKYLLEELPLLTNIESFVEYYNNITYFLIEETKGGEVYEDVGLRRSGLQFSYLDGIEKIGRSMRIDMSGEMNRYWNMFQDYGEISFDFLLEEAFDNLAFITSNRINTYEMLFEANEMEQQAEGAEAENERLVQNVTLDDENLNIEYDEKTETLLKDPEKMIKLLRKRRGI